MKISLTPAALASAMVLIPFSPLISQQASQAPPRILQFENQDVKVWKTTLMPGGPLEMHTHEYPRVVIALSVGTMKVVNEVGPPDVHEWETGKAYWLSREQGQKRHADSNVGGKPMEVMVVELKNAK